MNTIFRNIRSVNNVFRRAAITALGAAALVFTTQVSAADADDMQTTPRYEETEAVEQISAHDARRRAYKYLSKLGYSKTSGIGTAKVRAMTREGDTWVARVAYSTSGRALSNEVVLYINANTAFVSEFRSSEEEGRVAAR